MSTRRIYDVRLEGHLGADCTYWFPGLSFSNDDNGYTTLSAPTLDQAALPEVMRRLLDLNLPLVSVTLAERE